MGEGGGGFGAGKLPKSAAIVSYVPTRGKGLGPREGEVWEGKRAAGGGGGRGHLQWHGSVVRKRAGFPGSATVQGRRAPRGRGSPPRRAAPPAPGSSAAKGPRGLRGSQGWCRPAFPGPGLEGGAARTPRSGTVMSPSARGELIIVFHCSIA